MIAIAGGTGRVGKSLTRLLLIEGAELRVLTRDPQAARGKFGRIARLEFARIDFDDPQSLVEGFSGADAAFMSTGTRERQVDDEIALIGAALAAGVGYLVNLSAGGAQRGIPNPVLDWHSEIDAHLQAQSVDWTLLRPAIYADAIVDVAATLQRAGVWGGHAGNGRASLIDTRDVAAVAATVLLQGAPAHSGEIYDLTGPKAVTMHEVAKLIGGGVRYAERTRAQQRTTLESLRMPPLRVDVLLGLDDLFRDGVYATPATTVRDITGRPARPVEEYIQARRASFAPRAAPRP